MVIRIIVEGGVVGDDPTLGSKTNMMIRRNSAALREALHNFFVKAVGTDDIDMRITVGGSYSSAFKRFVVSTDVDFCYVDLDDKPENRESWFVKMKEEHHVDCTIGQHDHVFFWIPEMEAWFLKQPECIKVWAVNEGYKVKEGLFVDNNIKGKDIEHLTVKPSRIMDTLFGRYLESSEKDVRGKTKKPRYNKLITAPQMIPFLDASALSKQDAELCKFVICARKQP